MCKTITNDLMTPPHATYVIFTYRLTVVVLRLSVVSVERPETGICIIVP